MSYSAKMDEHQEDYTELKLHISEYIKNTFV